MIAWFDELRRSARNLRRRPGFAMLAGATLAFGVGACVAVFALVDAILLQPPPYPQAERLVVLGRSTVEPWSTISPQAYQLLGGLDGAERLGAKFAPKDVNVAGVGEPELVGAWPVDAGLLPTLGVTLELGRNFSAEEDRPNAAPVAILGHAFWQRHFNGDRGVIGRSVLVDGVASTVVGVLPASFRLDGSPDLLLPLALPAGSRDGASNLLAIARLEPGATPSAVGAAYDARLRSHAADLGLRGDAHLRFSATALAQNMGATARPVLTLFFACALCVLMLVAVNLINLMLLRGVARSHEGAVRAALGASTLRLGLPALAEGLLIGMIGALAGLAVAAAGLHLARTWIPEGWLPPGAALLGAPAMSFALAAALAVALLAAAVSVLRGGNPDGIGELRLRGGSRGAGRLGRGLVVAQAALATLLLAAAGLLTHSLWRLSAVELGFDAGKVLVFRLNPASALYPDTAAVQTFAQHLLERLRTEPGVRDVALTTNLPIGSQFNMPFVLPSGAEQQAQYRAVSADSFATLRTPLLAGRDFDDRDRAGSEPVAIVNAAFQREFFGGAALGKALKTGVGENPPAMRVVGVAADVRQFGPQEGAPPIVYVPLAQMPDALMNLIRRFVPLNAAVRVDGDPAVYADRMRAALREIDPRQGLAALRLLQRDVDDATAPQRMNASLITLFAAIALLLAGVGLYSVTAVAVAAREREFGVRAALGALPSRLLRGVLGAGLRDVGIGLVLGLAAAVAAGRLLQGFLFGVEATDPLALSATLIALLLVGLAATALPALRAARIDPMQALRNE